MRPTIAQLYVVLADVEPPVWRRVLVPHSIALTALHDVLQVVMGWEDAHLWEFRAGARAFGHPDPDWPTEGLQRATGVRLRELAPVEGAMFEYVYDLGDCWVHRIRLEALLPNLLPTTYGETAELPFCLAGARACPPEDAGGLHGYTELLSVLRGETAPDDPDLSVEDMRRWAGADFHPEAFSARQVNRELRLRAEARASKRGLVRD